MCFGFLLALLAVSPAEAQSGAAHHVGISVPDIIGIRIVGPGTGPRAVTFDATIDPSSFVDATISAGVLTPHSVSRFEDIQVNATRNGRWGVDVIATPWTYSGPGSGEGLPIESVRVRRSVRSGLTQDAILGPGQSAWILDSWSLSTASQRIAQRTGATGGWRSLGFNGWDYEIVLSGSEDPGTYTTIVTYSLSAP